MIQTCVYLHPVVRSYIRKAVEDPELPVFKLSYSSVVNLAVAEYAKANGQAIDLPAPKRRGRPPKAWDGYDRRQGESVIAKPQSKKELKEAEAEAKVMFENAHRAWASDGGSMDTMPVWSDYRDGKVSVE